MNDPESKIWIEINGYRYKFENEAWSSDERDSKHGVELLNSLTRTSMTHETAMDCVKKVLERAGLDESAIKEVHYGKIEDDVRFDEE